MKQQFGLQVECWLVNNLGSACTPASKFEDTKLGVDFWVRYEGLLIPVQLTINTDPEVIRHKWVASTRRGIVFIRLWATIKKVSYWRRHLWKMIKKAVRKGMVFLQKKGEGYQLPLPWFKASAPILSERSTFYNFTVTVQNSIQIKAMARNG